MKKVLEGELTSLAHSILKAKNDNVHELKEKAGLLYEKLCVLAFAEKHFAGKQPNIGKMAFKSAFETDLDEVSSISDTASEAAKETTTLENTLENENASTEKSEIEKEIQKTENSKPVEASKEDDENSAPTEASSNKSETSAEKVEQERLIANKKTSINQEDSAVKEAKSIKKEDNPQSTAEDLSEEDFGVHFDELPDFEPASTSSSTQLPTQEEIEIEQTSLEQKEEQSLYETQVTPSKNENKVDEDSTIEEDKPKPQRTMDLFSQEKKSLNDQLKTELKIGLNDRLAFTKKLFEGNVEAYHRVMAKINEFSNIQEAKVYLENQVKPSYNWHEHEAIEQRFLEILEAKLA